MPAPTIVWFRRDLRLADNPALEAAVRADGAVIPLYVLDETPGLRAPGAASLWWLDKSLASLTADLEAVGSRLEAGVAALERATDWILANKGPNALSGATPYLKLAGDVVGGWMLGLQALALVGATDEWSTSKAALARVYAAQVLAQVPGLAEGVMEGAADYEAVSARALGG